MQLGYSAANYTEYAHKFFPIILHCKNILKKLVSWIQISSTQFCFTAQRSFYRMEAFIFFKFGKYNLIFM
jgi:hypothetical protein